VGEVGVREVEMSCKVNEVESGGATSAGPEAANCASMTCPPRPADGDGNGELTSDALSTCLVSSPFSGTGQGVLTLGGTIANLRLSAALSTLLLCLRLCTAVAPKESFLILFPLGNGDEGEGSSGEFGCLVLGSGPVAL